MKTNPTSEEILFQESQRIHQWWVWALLAAINAVALIGIVRQVFYHIPFGEHPVSDIGLIVLFVLVIGITVFVASVRLETWISSEAVFVRFRPFQANIRRIPIADIERIYVRKYRPIAEFGGWGYRFSLSGGGTAWNISGSQGIQVEMKSGRKILIGTAHATEAVAALDQLA